MVATKRKLEPTRYQLYETACSKYHFDKCKENEKDIAKGLEDIKKLLNIINKKE